MIGYGVDLSHHQLPGALAWDKFGEHCDFAICRSSYGAKKRDKQVEAHVRRAREHGLKVGLYHFFRPSQGVNDQFDLTSAVADAVNIAEGDIIPTVDIERDPIPKPGTEVSPEWDGPTRELVERLAEKYGDCMIYITQREWRMLGAPQWVLDRPIWVAHYTKAENPAVPEGSEPVIWQHRVADFVPNGAGGFNAKAKLPIDQNRLLRPLPLIEGDQDEEPDIDHDQIMNLVAMTTGEAIDEFEVDKNVG